MTTIDAVKERLDVIIAKARVDLYKPVHIAEVLYRSRIVGDIDTGQQSTYQNTSLRWRDEVTQRLASKSSTSSARYQHDVWNPTAMPPEFLRVLDTENKATQGAVERYIYLRYVERQGTVSEIIAAIETAMPETFELRALFELFIRHPGIRRSIDKAYEIVVYSLFETLVTTLHARVRVSVPPESSDLLTDFSDLASILLGLEAGNTEREQDAHVYRVGVTNSADRGLDMFANFGPVIQVKHLTLNLSLANQIVDQVESDSIVVVCRDAEAPVIQAITQQIGWGRRVRGIVTESNLIEWYERCLRGKYADRLAMPLLTELSSGFKAEFPQSGTIAGFLEERGYLSLSPPERWRTDTDSVLKV